MTTIDNQTTIALNNETIIEQQDNWSRVENINNYSFKNKQILKIFYQEKPLINEYLVYYEKHNIKVVFEIDNDGDEYSVIQLEDIVVMDGNQPRKLLANQITGLWVEDKYKQHSCNYNSPIPRKLTYFDPPLATYSLTGGQLVSLIYHTNPVKLRPRLKVVSSSFQELHVMEGKFPRKFKWDKVISMSTEHIFHTKPSEFRYYINNNYKEDSSSTEELEADTKVDAETGTNIDSNIILDLNSLRIDVQLANSFPRTNMTTCDGCLYEQPNQMAHMGFGGCLED